MVQSATAVTITADQEQKYYDELYREYRALYDALTPIYRRLSSIGLEPME